MTYDENTIMGNISDKLTGKPIEGACVEICDNEYQPIVYNFTDVDGNFTLQGSFSPNIRVIAAKKGYDTFASEALPSANLEKKAINIELMPAPNSGIVFYGNVKDAQQNLSKESESHCSKATVKTPMILHTQMKKDCICSIILNRDYTGYYSSRIAMLKNSQHGNWAGSTDCHPRDHIFEKKEP